MALRQSPPSAPSAHPNRLRAGFILLCENLLDAISAVFPDCHATKFASEMFASLIKKDAAAQERLIRECHTVFKKHAADIKVRNPEAIFALSESIKVISVIDLRAKWNDDGFTSESKENLWAYLDNLKIYAHLYTCVPQGTMSKIEELASKVDARIQSPGEFGQFGMEGLDLAAFGRDVMSSMSPEEVSQLEANLPNIFECVGNVAGLLSPGGGAPGLDVEGLLKKVAQAQQGGEGNLNVGELLRNLSGGGKIDPSALLSVAQSLSEQTRGGGESSGRPCPASSSTPESGVDFGALLRALSGMSEEKSRGDGARTHPNIFAVEDGGASASDEASPKKKKRRGQSQQE